MLQFFQLTPILSLNFTGDLENSLEVKQNERPLYFLSAEAFCVGSVPMLETLSSDVDRNDKKQNYFTFFPATDITGFPATEFAVAWILGFSFFGFFASLFPRLLPLDMIFPSNMQKPVTEKARTDCCCPLITFGSLAINGFSNHFLA